MSVLGIWKDNKRAVVACLTVFKRWGDAGKPVTNVDVTTEYNFPSNKYFVTLRGLCQTAWCYNETVAYMTKYYTQGRQSTWNVTLRRVRVTIITVEKYWVLNILSAYLYLFLSHPAFKSHLFYVLLHSNPVGLYRIFFTLSHKRYGFLKNVIEHKTCVLIFSTTFI
jgi:hypothetical protein